MLSSLNRWNPSSPILTARDPFFRLFEPFFNQGQTGNEDVSNQAWMPPVDIQETEEGYRLTAELPGLTRDDINITLENNVLRLAGERKFEKDVKKESYHRIERAYGNFQRSFSLPHQVNPEKVEAAFKDGVLTIAVPKAEQARSRKITIA